MTTLLISEVEAGAPVPSGSSLDVARVRVTSSGSVSLHVARVNVVSDAPHWEDGNLLQVSQVQASRFGGVPTVSAGEGQEARAFDQVTLAGVASDGTTNWVQQQGPPVGLASSLPSVSFTALALATGATLVFEFSATNEAGTATDTVTVTVAPHIDWKLTADGWEPYRIERVTV